MLALGIDTTGSWCSVALVDGAGIRAMSARPMQRGHAEHLAPMVKTLLKQAGAGVENLGRLVVCTGPGSFTGGRVGLSFAKGLALPHNIPLIGLSALDVWAAQVDPERQTRVLVVADIRRGQIMTQLFDKGVPQGHPEIQPADTALPNAELAVGSGVNNSDGFVHPALLAWLGLDADPAMCPAEPLYARPPDAKLPGGKTFRDL